MHICSAGCRRESPLNDTGGPALPGWEYLSISNRYRCPDCSRELRDANNIIGIEPPLFVDEVPPDSRGALPKETASTITPPTLKG